MQRVPEEVRDLAVTVGQHAGGGPAPVLLVPAQHLQAAAQGHERGIDGNALPARVCTNVNMQRITRVNTRMHASERPTTKLESREGMPCGEPPSCTSMVLAHRCSRDPTLPPEQDRLTHSNALRQPTHRSCTPTFPVRSARSDPARSTNDTLPSFPSTSAPRELFHLLCICKFI